nr:double-stranded RNA-binding protein 4-like [Ipomoea batatas]GMD49357.1 double-stranded RNA-binding protein 4-like [Ipomoea batatas]
MAALLPSTEHPTQTPDNTSQATELPVQTQNTPQQAVNYKLILQLHTSKSHISNPTYEVSNEGPAHARRYRATVLVCEKHYTSHTTFARRKAAENDAAKIAWDDIATKTDDEEKLPDIEEYAFFCKCILFDFAAKMHFDNPTFDTTPTCIPDALVPTFKSVVTFNGKSYTGEPGQSKKEAERLAARAAILSLLESELKNDLSKVIKSTPNPFAKLNNVRDSSHLSTTNSSSGEIASRNNAIESLLSGLETVSSAQVMSPPGHEFNKPVVQSSTVSVAQPKSFVPPSVRRYFQYVHICGQKRKRNNK